ncbi:MAG: cation:proton antiporter [Gemmataceae bacterium]|nr:cation:proton antiporter [Gemmataceae bacterium]
MTLPSRAWIPITAYAGTIAAGVGVFLLICTFGETLSAPPPEIGTTVGVGTSTGTGHALFHVLLALAAVIALGRVLGKAFTWIGQPAVIGEIVAGILLGPSLLGRISPEAMQFLLPKDAAGHLGIIAQLGAILYMFIVGLELNTGQVRSLARSVVAISFAGLIGPFIVGMALALWLYPRFSNSSVPFLSFSLFVGIAVAITAFPVLARILKERQLDATRVGVTALGAAALADVVAWCLLAVVVGVARESMDGALQTILWATLCVAGMLLILRPLVNRFVRLHENSSPTSPSTGTIAFVILGVFLVALTTEWIGVHALFGAFLFGALIPHESKLAKGVSLKLSDAVGVVLLPAFFAFTGLRTEIGLLQTTSDWITCAGIVSVAYAAKFGSALLASRCTGHGWRNSAAIGVMMTTHGLMELIVLNIGLDLGVISPTLFAMMVVMALVTTMMTAPLLRVLLPRDARIDIA